MRDLGSRNWKVSLSQSQTGFINNLEGLGLCLQILPCVLHRGTLLNTVGFFVCLFYSWCLIGTFVSLSLPWLHDIAHKKFYITTISVNKSSYITVHFLMRESLYSSVKEYFNSPVKISTYIYMSKFQLSQDSVNNHLNTQKAKFLFHKLVKQGLIPSLLILM